ncbi:MAG: FAD-binding protein, partial [Treponema sp.]|nr:FAD-binding protein [Treponema sp.]
LVDSEVFTSKFWKLLRKNVVDRSGKIDVWYASPATRLIQDRDTRIIHGVTVQNSGKPYNVRAINGVVMAMGGFENSDEMLENYAQLASASSKAARYNTGDGIKMAIDVGADLWHMSALSGPDVNFVNPDTGISPGYYFTFTTNAGYATGFTAHNVINVGGGGTRFMNETEAPRHGHTESGGSWFSLLVPQNAWCVFDETARNTVPAYPSWSPGMEEEIARGWVINANTIAELAAKMHIDPAALAKTISDYNRYCAQGNDPDFHRDPQFLKPLSTGPFYAFPIRASLTNTQGGAKRNVKCEVLDVWGNPIPHLYSAGEFGSFYTDIYNGGGNLGECAFTGREAGKNAAAPKNDVPRTSVMGSGTPVDFRLPPPVYTAGPNEYIGVGEGIGGELVVKVTLDSAKKITNISFLRIHESRGISDRAVRLIPQAIIAANSANVDTVTGATVTSKAVIEAVNDALSKAR